MATAASIAEVQQAYVAYYGRPADPAGLEYWATRVDSEGIATLISAFGNSAEATARFGSLSQGDAIDAIYQQAFGRDAEAAGKAFYLEGLLSGQFTHVTLARDVVGGATGADATVLANKLSSAQLFTDSLDTEAEQELYSGDTASVNARTWLDAVDATPESVTTAAAAIAEVIAGLQDDGASAFTLTSGDDDFDLTSANDLVEGTTSLLGEDDRITDDSTTDSDVFNLTATGDPVAMDVRNVENINVNWDAFSTADLDLDNVVGATVTISSEKAGFNGNVNLTNVSSNAFVAGSGMTGAVDVQGIEDSSIVANFARSLAVGGTDAADGSLSVEASTASTVSITGGDDLTIDAQAARAITIASTGLDTADITVGVNTNLTSDGTSSIVTLRSDETIEVEVVNGTVFEELLVVGAGSVTLDLADTSDFTGDTITGAAVVKLSDDAGGAFDGEDFDTALVQYESTQTTGVHTYSSGANIQADVDFGAAVTFATSNSNDGSNDEITLTTKAAQTGLLFNTTDRDFELVNLNVDAVAALTLAAVTANTDGQVNIASNQNLTITAITAGTVDASTVAKTLTVTGHAGDQTIVAGTSVNTATFAGTTHDSAYVGGAANDTVTFVNTTGDLSAIMYAGVNSVTANALTTGTAYISGGAGNDTIDASALTTGTLIAELGDGLNTVTVDLAAGVTGTVSIVGGSGNDSVTATVSTGSLISSLGAGVNSLTAAALTSGSLVYTGGAGNDTIATTDLVTGTQIVDAGDGINSLDTNLTTGTLTYVGGAGNDTVTADAGTTGTMTINLGDGVLNTATVALTTGKVTVVGGSGADTMTITALTTGTLSIEGGSGNDTISVDGVVAAGASVTVDGGAGSDVITLQDASATGSTISVVGGDGTDTVALEEDMTDGTLVLDVEVIDIDDDVGTVVVDGALLNGQSYTITADGADATDRLAVHIDTVGTYDFSGIQISGVVGSLLGGLAVTNPAINGANSIVGTSGNDNITGGDGKDTINGGSGVDLLDGGSGNDTIVFGATSETRVTGYLTAATTGFVDQITVTAAEDFIQLSSSANAYGSGITLDDDTVIVLNSATVTSGDYADLTAFVTTGAAAAFTEVASTSDTLYVYVVRVTDDTTTTLDFDTDAAGYYLFINDGTTLLATADTIIYLGTTDPVLTEANFTVG